MTSLPNYTIRPMTRDELDIAIEWAAAEGWNPGLYDADAFWAQDPDGFFVGILDGEIIATVSAVKYGDSYCFGGFYIVKKEYRGEGYGMALFQKAQEYAQGRNLAGDGVVENLDMYAQVGLKLDHMNARYQGFGTGTGEVSENVVPLSEVKFEQISNFDFKVFGFEREKFLKKWITQPESFAYGYLNGGELEGYSVMRKCHSGYKVGPLFAKSDDIARALYDTLVGQVSTDTEVFFDIPEVNEGSLQIVKDYDMTKVFATGRIYTAGRPPTMKLEYWYGVTTFELG